MANHHIFATNVLEDFEDVLSAIRAGINEASNLVELPTTQLDALRGAETGNLSAAHTGGHLSAYYSETTKALEQIRTYLRANPNSAEAVDIARNAYYELQSAARAGLTNVEVKKGIVTGGLITNRFSMLGQTRAEANQIIREFFAANKLPAAITGSETLQAIGTVASAIGTDAGELASAAAGAIKAVPGGTLALKGVGFAAGKAILPLSIAGGALYGAYSAPEGQELRGAVEGAADQIFPFLGFSQAVGNVLFGPDPSPDIAARALSSPASHQPHLLVVDGNGLVYGSDESNSESTGENVYNTVLPGIDVSQPGQSGLFSSNLLNGTNTESYDPFVQFAPNAYDALPDVPVANLPPPNSSFVAGATDGLTVSITYDPGYSGGQSSYYGGNSQQASYYGGSSYGNSSYYGGYETTYSGGYSYGNYSADDYAAIDQYYAGDYYSDGLEVDDSIAYAPVILDLSGDGINITQASSSNQFFDMSGDGYQHLTAWAGAGNAVLFIDTTGAGVLSQANQIVFTDWDPSASNDMQALKDVFDTNHDGKLDAGDASYADFFLSITNSDGTTTIESLAQAGIASIDLTPNAVNQTLPDGSSIDGETTYATTSGAQGAAATVSLASDSNGYSISTTKTTNADGSTTIDNVGSAPSGGISFERILNTSADASSKVLTELSAGGVVESIQVDVLSTNADGSTTETLTNYAGGTISAADHSGELGSSVSLTGAEKLNSTKTTVEVVDGVTTKTILRDQIGGGWITQEEVDVANADGSSSITVSNLNPDGSSSDTSITAVSADGLTRTTTNLIDGAAANAISSTDATVVHADGTRTETVTDLAGTTVVSVATTETSSDGVSRQTSSDVNGDGTVDIISTSGTTKNSDGTTTTTEFDQTAGGQLIDATQTVTSADGLTVVTQSDLDGRGTVAAPVWNEVDTKSTVYADDKSYHTVTETVTSEDGTLISSTTTKIFADGVSRIVAVDSTGDHHSDQTETISLVGGVTTDTQSTWNPDGSLASQTVVETLGGGLNTTTSIDRTGATGANGAAVFDDVVTDIVTKNANGSSSETIQEKGATGQIISTTQIATSEDGLSITTSSDVTGANSIADGVWDSVTSDDTVINVDGSYQETVTDKDGFGNTLDQTIKAVSADRKTVTTTSILGAAANAFTEAVESVVTQEDGTIVDTQISFDKNGDVTGATVTTTSADGLNKVTQTDQTGQTAAQYAASGLAFDQVTSDITVINADGSETETVETKSQDGTVVSSGSVTTSADGMTVTTVTSPHATAHFASKTTSVTSLSANGETTEEVRQFSYDGSLVARQITTTSANGLSTTTAQDLDGDGKIDETTTDITTINGDGSETRVVTDYIGGTDGNVRDVVTTTSGIVLDGIGLETIVARQSNGSVPFYQSETVSPSANGSISDITRTYDSLGGSLLLQTTKTTSANDLVKETATAIDGHTAADFWTTDTTTINSDNSTSEAVAKYNNAGLVSETITTKSENGLLTVTKTDNDGALDSNGNPIFNSTTSDLISLDSDGGQTETVTETASNGSVLSQIVSTLSADGQHSTINMSRKANGGGIYLADAETIDMQSDGTMADTAVGYDQTGAVIGSVVKQTSGNGLTTSITYKNASGAAIDTQTDVVTYSSSGAKHEDAEYFSPVDIVMELWDELNPVNETIYPVHTIINFESSRIADTSGNSLEKSVVTTLSGAAPDSYQAIGINTPVINTVVTSTARMNQDDVTVVDDNGATTETSTISISGAITESVSSLDDEYADSDVETTVVSANQLLKTVSVTLDGAHPYLVDETHTELDGSSTETITVNGTSSSTFYQRTVVNTSADGRTTETDRDTALANGTTSDESDTTIENADGSVSETRVGTGSYGTVGFRQTIEIASLASSGRISETENYDSAGILVSQIVSEISADGLFKSFVYDTTGHEAEGDLATANEELISASSLTIPLLVTDIAEKDITVLNSDGSRVETITTAYGGNFDDLRSRTVITTSADGLQTVTQVDDDGNGFYEQVETATIHSDGSRTTTVAYYGNTAASNSVQQALSTDIISADGLVDVVTVDTGVSDTTVHFANSNGSYDWSQSIVPFSYAQNTGFSLARSSHVIDANGIDTWSWYDNGKSGTVVIGKNLEDQDVAIANEIYLTLTGQGMTDEDTQTLARFIVDGQLDRLSLASSIAFSSGRYSTTVYGVPSSEISGNGFYVSAAFVNALGRQPTADEMAQFISYATTSNYAGMAVAIAQYAMDLNASNNRTVVDPNSAFAEPEPVWGSSVSQSSRIYEGENYTASNEYLYDLHTNTHANATIGITGDNDEIVAKDDSTITVSGFNDAVDNVGGALTVNGNDLSLLIENGTETVNGNDNQIAVTGQSQLTVQSGVGNAIYTQNDLPDDQSTINASNSTISLGESNQATVVGDNDVIDLVGRNVLTATGTGNTVDVLGDAAVDTINISGAGITIGGLSSAAVTGNDNVLQLGVGSSVIVQGSSNTITLSGGDALQISAENTIIAQGQNNSITISDSLANILGDFGTLEGLADLKKIILTDGGVPVLTKTASEISVLSELLNKVQSPLSIVVADSAANISANANSIFTLGNLASISLTDIDVPTLTLTAAQAASGEGVLSKINSSFNIAVVDTASLVGTYLDSLNSLPNVTSITLTDGGVPTLHLTVAEALGSATSKIEGSYNVSILDSAANVGANIDALNALQNLSSITLNDAGVPTLVITPDQATTDATVLNKISNRQYNISGVGPSGVVTDSEENVSLNFDALNANSRVTQIFLDDGATLTLSVRQVINDTAALAKAAGYAIAITDTAENIAASFDALNANNRIHSIVFTDAQTPQLELTAEEAVNDQSAFEHISGSYLLSIADSAVNVAAYFNELSDIGDLSDIVLKDAGVPTLDISVAQYSNGKTLLDKIVGNYELTIADTAAAVAADIDGLNSSSEVPSIALTDAGTPTLTLTAAQLLNDTAVLGRVVGVYTVAVRDTASNIVQNLGELSTIGSLRSISAVDSIRITLNVAQALGNPVALSKIDAGTSITVSDTEQVILSNLALLAETDKITSISVADLNGSPLTLTAAEVEVGLAALNKIAVTGLIVDTAAAVSTYLDAIDDYRNASIQLTDSGVPALSLSVAQLVNDQAVLNRITGSYEINIVDSLAEVLENINVLNARQGQISTIELTDSGTPVLQLSAQAVADDSAVLGAITSPYKIEVSDTAENILANLDALNNASITAITLTDSGTPVLAISLSQVADDASALSKIAGSYSLTVSGSATDISSELNVLNSLSQLSTISITAGSTALDLTAQQVAQDGIALSKIAGDFVIDITDTPANIAANLAALNAETRIRFVSVSGIVQLTADQIASNPFILGKLHSVGVADTAAAVSANIDALSNMTSVISISLTDGGRLALTVAEIASDRNGLFKISGARSFDVVDNSANIETLQPNQIQFLAPGWTLNSIHSTDSYLSLSVAQVLAYEQNHVSLSTGSGGVVMLSDSAANLQTLSTSQIAGLQNIGVNEIVVTSGNAVFSTDQSNAIAAADLEIGALSGNAVTLAVSTSNMTMGMSGNADLTLTGSRETINISGTTNALAVNSASVNTSAGSDVVISGADDRIVFNGSSSVMASGTNEIYCFGAGSGQDLVKASDATSTGEIDVAAGLTKQNLWFEQSGNDLKIDVMGTDSSLTVQDWFGGSGSAAAQSIVTSDGSRLDSQISQLVSAMATYSANNSGFDPAHVSQAPADSSLQTTIAAAWH